MEQFILGANKEGKLIQYTNMMDAMGSSEHAVGIYTENLEKAQSKYRELEYVDFKPATTGAFSKSPRTASLTPSNNQPPFPAPIAP